MQDQLSLPSNFFVSGNNVLYLLFDYKQIRITKYSAFVEAIKEVTGKKKSNQVETNFARYRGG